MSEELININKEILLKGLFALKYSEGDGEVTRELEELEKTKKDIKDRLGGMNNEYKLKIHDYKQQLIETENKYKLNLEKNPKATITDKIEEYKIYRSIYDEHYEYIKSIKELNILDKTYNGEDYHYLITKI
jgi:phage-related protein|tara:strand:- start:130 stop:522 length:393 start_codon:yes stop_codon:yes gene_type:complete